MLSIRSPGPSFSTFAFSKRSRTRRNTFFLFVAFTFIFLVGYSDKKSLDRTTVTLKTFIEPIKVTVVGNHRSWRSAPWPTTASDKDKDKGGVRRFFPAGKSILGDFEYHETTTTTGAAATTLLERHRYNRNGLLEVNPKGPHPIFELIERSEAEWKAKLERASRTLEDAVIEYERRYARKPPIGFDKWWAYVVEHNVQLPDEYDQIHNDLEAFWGISPTDLQQTELAHEIYLKFESFTIGKLAYTDPITVLNRSEIYTESFKRHDMTWAGDAITGMLREAGLEKWIPPFRATFSPHDNPSMQTDWELWKKGVDYAKRGKTFSMINDPVPQKTNGWLSSCSPQSPARNTPIDFEAQYPLSLRPSFDPLSTSDSRSFIYDHKKTMDPCTHPHLFRQHGQFVKLNRGQNPPPLLVPYFSYSPTLLHHDITSAIPLNWVQDVVGGDNPPWEEKTDERLHWRGSNTGTYYGNKYQWWLSHRTRLMEFSQRGYEESLRVIGLGVGKGEGVGEGRVVRKGRWAPAMLDISFTGKPMECNVKERVCDKLWDLFEWRKGVSMRDAGRFKWILDVDGNAWSSRFKRLITSSSCIFKSTIYPEWFTDRIQPWVHYVPIQVDLSDLWDTLAFFRGDPNGDFGHDELGKKIGQQGREWSLGFWREEDMVAYNFRLFLEYARVMSTDREKMSFIYNEDLDFE